MKILYALLICLLLAHCKPLPEKRLIQSSPKLTYKWQNDSLTLSLTNTLHCPLRVWPISKQEKLSALWQADLPLVLRPLTDTIIRYKSPVHSTDQKIVFNWTFGDPNQPVRDSVIALPFPAGRQYEIIQGYNGRYSHQSNYSRYALDFSLQVGDTVCAAAAGYVIGVIEGYKYGGAKRKWRDYANFLTLFHPDHNLYTQYVHLKFEGSMVELGERVEAGQPIALSGMTGFTSVAHLHFNVLVPTQKSLESMPVRFEEGFEGSSLTKGRRVSK